MLRRYYSLGPFCWKQPFTPRNTSQVPVGENPSWAWFNVTVISGGGSLVLILCTGFILWARGYLVS